MRVFLALTALLYLAGTESVMVCYYGSWAYYRPGNGKFSIDNIDPFICTHLVYTFAGLDANTNTIKVLDPYYDLEDNFGLGGYKQFTALKLQNPELKTTLAVGGWNEGSTKYSNMAMNATKRTTFINSVIVLLNEHNFDGLDMDWEYPANRGGIPEDKANFVTLLSELATALHAEGMILTAAVSAGKTTIDTAYDIPGVSAQLDLIHVMAYDLHGSWDLYTHHHTITNQYSGDTGDNIYLNVDYALNYWIDGGAAKEKLVLGTAAYGRSFTLANSAEHGMYATASAAGQAGSYTSGEPGFLGYNEVCEKMSTMTEWTIVREPEMSEPYVYRRNFWIGYEDVNSIAMKGVLARDMGIAGVMIWSIETDDFKPICGSETFPLVRSVHEAYLDGEIPPPPTQDPNMSTVTTPAPPTVDPNESCQEGGPNPYPGTCTKFYNCREAGDPSPDIVACSDLLFDQDTKVCDWDYNVCPKGNCPDSECTCCIPL